VRPHQWLERINPSAAGIDCAPPSITAPSRTTATGRRSVRSRRSRAIPASPRSTLRFPEADRAREDSQRPKRVSSRTAETAWLCECWQGMGAMVVNQPPSGLRRVPLLRRCVLQGPGVHTVGILCNLSFRGAYLAVGTPPKIGERVLVSFQLPWWDDLLAIDALVCWDNSERRASGLPAGCGVEFLAPTWKDQARIESVVRAFGRSADLQRAL
jgi:hypothetical protein